MRPCRLVDAEARGVSAVNSHLMAEINMLWWHIGATACLRTAVSLHAWIVGADFN